MITVRQIERLWYAKAYDRLLQQLVAPRPEGSDQLLSHLSGSLPAAAMAVIRLDELAQSFAPIYGELIRTILRAQRPDGGWGDVMTTALCLRALFCGNGNGQAIDQGVSALAALQKSEGIWPAIPARRMPVDAFASAFVLHRLGDVEPFRQSVDMASAIKWFEINDPALDEQTRRLWAHARRRLGVEKGARSNQPAKAAPASASMSFWDFSSAVPT
jgi:hypothetical protein